jgi:hypothetical protein
VLVRGSTAAVVSADATSIAASPSSTSTPPAGDDIAQKRAKQSATYTPLSEALIKDPQQLPFKPRRSRYIDERGLFVVSRYDDRRGATDELPDPRWPDFVRCMQQRGFATAIADPNQTRQADINALTSEVNRSAPFEEAQPDGPTYLPSPAGDAFIACERSSISRTAPRFAPRWTMSRPLD